LDSLERLFPADSGTRRRTRDLGLAWFGPPVVGPPKTPQLRLRHRSAANVSGKQLEAMQALVGVENHALNHGTTYPEITMPATMHAAAASSHVWISCSNSSARQSCWPAFFVRADGVVTGRLRRNVAGVLTSIVDTRKKLYDSTKDWRGRAMKGVLHSGRTVVDVRSKNRTEL
jgi:hypothetical protein